MRLSVKQAGIVDKAVAVTELWQDPFTQSYKS